MTASANLHRIALAALLSALFALFVPSAGAQLQLAITFDDLPAHGAHPPALSRLDIIQSILATLQREHLPPAYGFFNGVRTEEHPETLAVLQAWLAAGQPLANHTWSHPNLANTLPYLDRLNTICR